MKKVAVTRVDKNEFFSDEKELIILKSSEGLAHMATNDDEYNGYYIPKGTLLIVNAWLTQPLNPIFCPEFLI